MYPIDRHHYHRRHDEAREGGSADRKGEGFFFSTTLAMIFEAGTARLMRESMNGREMPSGT